MLSRLPRLASTLRCRLLLGLVLSLLVSIAPAAADKRVALVIGNAAYRNLPRLETPKNDAELMADTLRATGFSLVGGRAQLDLDKAGFEAVLINFSDQLSGADVALLYYAGHGVQRDGVSYLLPVDVAAAKQGDTKQGDLKQADLPAQAIDVADMLKRLGGARTKLNLVLLDASRPNPFVSGQGAAQKGSADGGLGELQPPPRTLVSAAAWPGQLARDGRDGTSLYAAALSRQMLRPGLDLFAAFHEADLAVRRATNGQQEVWVVSSSVDGAFQFVPTAPVQPFPQTAAPPPSEDATRAWAAAQKNPALLEDFIRRYGNTVYGEAARARFWDTRRHDTGPAFAATPPPSLSIAPPVAVAPAPTASGLPPSGVALPDPALFGTAGTPRVVLYEEDPAVAEGQRFAGTVTWSTELTHDAAGLAVRAIVDVPARGVRLSLRMRKNLDTTLPASHTLDVSFTVPPQVNGGGINNLPGVLMKTSENTKGTPLSGLAVKIIGNVFLVGLSNVAADRTRNLELLASRSWFDIPIVFANQRRAILAIEKGDAGQRAFSEALAAWASPSLAVPVPPPGAPANTAIVALASPPAGADDKIAGEFLVQLSTQRSQAEAEASYRALQDKYPTVLASRPPLIRRLDLHDKGIFFRASAGPFATIAEATQLCTDLKTAGGQCLVQWTPR